jgi:hypothetical protein
MFILVIVTAGFAVAAEIIASRRCRRAPPLTDLDAALALDAARDAAYALGAVNASRQPDLTFAVYIAAGVEDAEAYANGERRQP